VTLPSFELASVSPADVVAALAQEGAVLMRDASVSVECCARALADVAGFFALPRAAKQELALERSSHFRGYSEMHNERDWREQLHLGPELPPVAGDEPFWRLQGPNLWPADAAWRVRMLEYLAQVESAGTRLLGSIAAAFGLAAEVWLGDSPYVLMKCIGYHPQPGAHARRQGVAAHLDFSLVTLTLQDDVGGLEVQRPSGEWVAVPPMRGTWLVNVGELLQFVTGGRLVATPHRVVNPSVSCSRFSIPVFVNPSLTTRLGRASPPVPSPPRRGGHVHAVLSDDVEGPWLHFGEAEWRRKGQNVWCTRCEGGGGSMDSRLEQGDTSSRRLNAPCAVAAAPADRAGWSACAEQSPASAPHGSDYRRKR
jgi:isopenicillin N synthase-like dioxygenase